MLKSDLQKLIEKYNLELEEDPGCTYCGNGWIRRLIADLRKVAAVSSGEALIPQAYYTPPIIPSDLLRCLRGQNVPILNVGVTENGNPTFVMEPTHTYRIMVKPSPGVGGIDFYWEQVNA